MITSAASARSVVHIHHSTCGIIIHRCLASHNASDSLPYPTPPTLPHPPLPNPDHIPSPLPDPCPPLRPDLAQMDEFPLPIQKLMIRLHGEGPRRAGSHVVEREHEGDECRIGGGAGEAGDSGCPVVTETWGKGTEESVVRGISNGHQPSIGTGSMARIAGAVATLRCSSTYVKS